MNKKPARRRFQGTESASEAEFEVVRKRALRAAAAWVRSVETQSLPTPIHELAAKCRVKVLQFKVIVSTAGVKKYSDGFAIVVNALGDGVKYAAGTEMSPGVEWATLPPMVRFSIAHELAHLLLYDAIDEDEVVSVLDHNWEAVEIACNRIGGMLLLPKASFLRELQSGILDTGRIDTLCAKFGVSREAILRRMCDEEIRTNVQDFDGLVALLKAIDNDLRIVAPFVRGPLASGRFKVKEKSRLDRLHLPKEIEAAIQAGEPINGDIVLKWREFEVIHCHLQFAPSRHGQGGQLLVRVTGGPDKIPEASGKAGTVDT